MERVEYGGWPNCVRLTNGKIDLIATTDVGPRVIRLGFVGGENEFHEDASQLGKTGGDDWMCFGGHRLWHAPEAKPRTYALDNTPVKFEMAGNTLRLMQDMESTTGIEKSIEITVDQNSNHVELVHKITNRNLWSVELAPWALSVMHSGGKAIIPNEPYSPHPDIPDFQGQKIDPKYYLPTRNIVMWSYTNLGDPRFAFKSDCIIMRQDPDAKRPQKIGISIEQSWGAYARNGHLFVKNTQYHQGATYPDQGCNFEVFTNSDMLELESLGPIVTLAPGATTVHREDWYLLDNVNFEETDESIETNVLSKVSSVLKHR